jgi:hypothetical protein
MNFSQARTKIAKLCEELKYHSYRRFIIDNRKLHALEETSLEKEHVRLWRILVKALHLSWQIAIGARSL